MTDNESFIRAIHADPHNPMPALVWADYLAEHGMEGAGEIIRKAAETHDPRYYFARSADPQPWTGYSVPRGLPPGQLSAWLTKPWGGSDIVDGKAIRFMHRYGVGFHYRLPPDLIQPLVAQPGERLPRRGSHLRRTLETIYSGPRMITTIATPEEAHHYLQGMPGVLHADQAIAELERLHPHLRGRTRMSRPVRYSHQAFHQGMLADSSDVMTPQVYADWLQEHDMPQMEEIVRRWVERNRRGPWVFESVNLHDPNGADGWLTRVPQGLSMTHADYGANHPNQGDTHAIGVHYRDGNTVQSWWSDQVGRPEALHIARRLHDEGVQNGAEVVDRLSRPGPRRRFARNSDYNQLFSQAADAYHATLPPEQQAAHRPALEKFKTLDHFGIIKGLVKGNADLAHDVATRMLYGNVEGKSFFAGHDPNKSQLASRFYTHARSHAQAVLADARGFTQRNRTGAAWTAPAGQLSVAASGTEPLGARRVSSEMLQPARDIQPYQEPRAKRPKMTEAQRQQIAQLHIQGHSLSQIAAQVGASKASVGDYVKNRMPKKTPDTTLPPGVPERLARAERRHRFAARKGQDMLGWHRTLVQAHEADDEGQDQTAMIYADWLEDHGHPTAASIIRHHVQEQLTERYGGAPIGFIFRTRNDDNRVAPGKFLASANPVHVTNADSNRIILRHGLLTPGWEGHPQQISWAGPEQSPDEMTRTLDALRAEGIPTNRSSNIRLPSNRNVHPNRMARPRRFGAEDLPRAKPVTKVQDYQPGMKPPPVIAKPVKPKPKRAIPIIDPVSPPPGRPTVQVNWVRADQPMPHPTSAAPEPPIDAEFSPAGEEEFTMPPTKLHSIFSTDPTGRAHLHTVHAADEAHARQLFGMRGDLSGHTIHGVTEGPPGAEATRLAGQPKRLARPLRHSGPHQRLARVRRFSAADGSHEGFHRAMLEDPSDIVTPQVYADWLEESGKPVHASVIRRAFEQMARTGRDDHYIHSGSVWGGIPPGDSDSVVSSQNNRYRVALMFHAAAEHPDKPFTNRIQFTLHGLTPEDASVYHQGLKAEGSHMTKADPLAEGFPHARFAAYKAPAGGLIVRGMFYQGGKMVPDLQKYGNPKGGRRGRAKARIRNRAKARIRNRQRKRKHARAEHPMRFSAMLDKDLSDWANSLYDHHQDQLRAGVYADWLEERDQPGAAEIIRRSYDPATQQGGWWKGAGLRRLTHRDPATLAFYRGEYPLSVSVNRLASGQVAVHLVHNGRGPRGRLKVSWHAVVVPHDEAIRLLRGMPDVGRSQQALSYLGG